MRRSILPFVKLLSRELTALNLLPSIATLAFVSSPMVRHNATNRAQTFLHGAAIILAEVGDRLVIRNQPSRQPHHLDIAASLTLKPPARLDPIEIAVDVELEQDDG